MISVGSIFLCFAFSILISLYLGCFLSAHNLFTKGIKVIFSGIIIIFLRMLIPLNFPFTISIPVTRILPVLTDFLYKPRNGISIFEAFIIIIGIGAFLKFVLMWKNCQLTYRRLLCYLEWDTVRTAPVYRILNKYNITDIRVAISSQKISPALCGVLNPILVLPEWALQDEGLEYMVVHEIEHYKNGDIWIKAVVELVECLYWWNPFICFLKKRMYLVMELSNDQVVMRNLSTKGKLDYASCLLKAAKVSDTKYGNSIPFFNDCNDLKIRVSAIINDTQNSFFYHRIRLYINIVIVSAMIFCSFVFVPEAYEVPVDIEYSSFIIPEDSAYLIKTSYGYKLYINDNYIATLEQIDDTLNNIKIIKEELR